jgi:hypothetical protein
MTAEARAHANPRATTFVGGSSGAMAVVSHTTLSGLPIASVAAVEMIGGIADHVPAGTAWALYGVSSNARYTTHAEQVELSSKQARIGRPEATSAALILLRKRAEWWALTQDERRAILEEDSHHIAIGMRYLPAIARRLLHCRDLDREAPFDFLGFLDYAPENEAAFNEMLARLRATNEWSFMDRETDIRLTKSAQ